MENKKINTKERIFETAVEFFAERGYQGASMRDLASKVGIKESSLYYHFPSKGAILEEILEYYMIGFKSTIPTQEEMEKTSSQFDDPVELWIYGIREFYMKQPPLLPVIATILLNEMFINKKCRNFVLHSMFNVQKETTEMLFRDMLSKGLIKNCNIEKKAAQYVYMLYGLDIENRLRLMEGDNKEEIQNNLFQHISIFIEGLK